MASSLSFPPPPSNVGSFVTVKLRHEINDRNKYEIWRKQMECLVQSQGLVRFIEDPRPPNADDAWRRTDWLVKGWILGTLSDEVIINVESSQSSRDVWLMLEYEFSESKQGAPPPPPPPGPSVPAADQGKYLALQAAIVSGDRAKSREILDQDTLRVKSFGGDGGFKLLVLMIDAGFFDLALDLVSKYHDMVKMKPKSIGNVLKKLALKGSAFYLMPQSFDIESQTCCTISAPRINRFHEKKLMRQQALELMKCICKHMESLDYQYSSAIWKDTILIAAESGNHDVVEEIVRAYPLAINSTNSTNETFLHLAVKNRCENVFNLLYQSNNNGIYNCSNKVDNSGNSILHLAACLAPPYKLNLVSGAALQMQREIQWFKEASKFVSPFTKQQPNKSGQTAKMIFMEEHKKLKIEGEKWMKDTANSCTIAAALIATVVFAAAITVPGGNQSESGYPMFYKSSVFTIFAVSDAVSLFTSTTSLLMFLSILTSRYAEQDFLYALPKRLCIGLFTLFVSILFMMIAFSSTLYLVFGRKKAWVLLPVGVLTCLPISSFVLLQYPLLRDVISSTYGRGIFGKQE